MSHLQTWTCRCPGGLRHGRRWEVSSSSAIFVIPAKLNDRIRQQFYRQAGSWGSVIPRCGKTWQWNSASRCYRRWFLIISHYTIQHCTCCFFSRVSGQRNLVECYVQGAKALQSTWNHGWNSPSKVATSPKAVFSPPRGGPCCAIGEQKVKHWLVYAWKAHGDPCCWPDAPATLSSNTVHKKGLSGAAGFKSIALELSTRLGTLVDLFRHSSILYISWWCFKSKKLFYLKKLDVRNINSVYTKYLDQANLQVPLHLAEGQTPWKSCVERRFFVCLESCAEKVREIRRFEGMPVPKQCENVYWLIL